MRKIIGIFIVTLLIGTLIIPISSGFYLTDNKTRYHNNIQSDNSELKWIFGGSGLRCLRFFRLYVPSTYSDDESVPLVIALHGSTGIGRFFNPSSMIWFYQDTFFEEYTDLNEKAEEEGFIVVYPKALPMYSPAFKFFMFGFNVPVYPDSWVGMRNLIDDVGFIDDLINKMKADYNINQNRIYVTGFSNGADMTHSLGCIYSDKIAAIGVVAGEIAKKDTDDEEYHYPKDPDHPISVIMFHGTNDSSYPWNGDQWGCGVDSSLQFWVQHNGCNSEPDVYESESGNIFRYIYTSDTNNEVILYKIVEGTHCWPGNTYTDPNNVAPWLVDSIQEIKASDLMWEFFEAHPKQ